MFSLKPNRSRSGVHWQGTPRPAYPGVVGIRNTTANPDLTNISHCDTIAMNIIPKDVDLPGIYPRAIPNACACAGASVPESVVISSVSPATAAGCPSNFPASNPRTSGKLL
jgi:hypothetical protein